MIQKSYRLLKENGQSKDALTTHWKQNEALRLTTQQQWMDTQSPKENRPKLGYSTSQTLFAKATIAHAYPTPHALYA